MVDSIGNNDDKVINELLELFDEKAVKELILLSYKSSKKKNSELTDKVFDKLLYMKKNHNITIIIDEDIMPFYEGNMNTIYVNDSMDPVAFFHELMHAFNPFLYLDHNIHQNIDEYVNILYSQEGMNHKLSLLVDQCENEMFRPRIDPSPFHIMEDSLPDEITDSLIEQIECAVDAISGGAFHSGSNTRICGHPCEYFAISRSRFEEIFASFFSVYLIKPDYYLFNKLKEILGNEFIDVLNEQFNYRVNFEKGNKMYKER